MQINQNAYRSLREDVGEEVFLMILEQFRRELESREHQLSEKIQSSDIAGLGEDAHSLKSTARTVGLDEIADAAGELESAARAGESASALSLASKLVEMCVRGQKALDEQARSGG